MAQSTGDRYNITSDFGNTFYFTQISLTDGTSLEAAGLSIVFDSQAERMNNNAVPEPASCAMWGLGLLGCTIGAYRRRKSAQQQAQTGQA